MLLNNIQLTGKKLRQFGFIFGSLLVGISIIPFSTQATSVPLSNSCPNLFLEMPNNQSRVAERRENCTAIAQLAPPLPEEIQPPSATVEPVNGTVNVTLVNQTYTDINYQVIGDTKPRTLSGRSNVTLTTLQLPVTVTFQRPDRGLLLVNPQASQAGTLEVTLTETTDLGIDKNAMTIQETGEVFLN